MKQWLFVAAVLILSVSLFSTSLAQNSATASSQAKAKIVAGLSLVNQQYLDFGNIVSTVAGGTATVTSNNNETYNGVYAGQNNVHYAAGFEAEGEPDYSYTISLPEECTLTLSGGSATMTVDNFTHSTAGTLNIDGVEDFTVGGTLNVGAGQAAGQYVGSFDVTVQYE